MKTLERRRSVSQDGGSKQGRTMGARPRGDIENSDDPRGEFALYLRDWFDRKQGGDLDRAAKTLGVSRRTVQNWMKGLVGPNFADLDDVAKALGYADWPKLGEAVKRFNAKR